MRLPLALLLALPLFAAPAAAAEEAERHPAVLEALALVRESARSAQVDPEELRRGLVALGPDALPAIFAVYDVGVIDDGEGGGLVLSAVIRGALWASLGEQPRQAVREHLEQFGVPDALPRTRRSALRVLGGVGAAQDFELFGRLASPPGWPVSKLEQETAHAFGHGLRQLLERDPGAVHWIHELYEDVPAPLWSRVLEGVRLTPTTDRMNVLAGLLGRVPASDVHVLFSVTSLARLGRNVHDEYVRGSVRRYLESPDPLLVMAAAEAAGALGDESAVGRLVELLADDDPRMRSTLRTALVSIVGRDLGADAGRWDAWYREEQRFWREDSHRWIAQLSSDDPSEVVSALTRLAGRSLYRGELAHAIAPVLGHGTPSLRALACSALGQLDVASVRGEVERLLDDPDEAVRAQARTCLAKLSVRRVRLTRVQR